MLVETTVEVKPKLGHYKKAGVEAHRVLREFRVTADTEIGLETWLMCVRLKK